MTGAAPRITWISPDDPANAFPPLNQAFAEPEGLLAAGGDLSIERLLYAYRHGIFPWYDEAQPILWWSPAPRCILLPAEFHLARRLRRWLKSSDYRISFNTAFDQVIKGCAAKRQGQVGTWITGNLRAAFCSLHRAGWAHSVEVWHQDQLIGGLYGLSTGLAFFGESMFSRKNNASKAAMLALCQQLTRREFTLLDCQMSTPHLQSLGATLVPRTEFVGMLEKACAADSLLELDPGIRPINDYLS